MHLRKTYNTRFLLSIIIFIIIISFTFNSKYIYLESKYLELKNENEIITAENADLKAQMQIIIDKVYNIEELYKLLLENESSDKNDDKVIELNLTDITSPSNLTSDQFNQIIKKYLLSIGKDHSKMFGIGNALVKIEKEYQVNGLLCLAVASLESGYGTSNSAYTNNNLFGLIGSNGLMKFDSVDECIIYWGKLIRNYYIDNGLYTIYAIGTKYCPESDTWVGNVSYLMKEYANQVNS